MKLLVFAILLGSVCFTYSSCTKDKTPNIVFDPTCSDTISFSQDIFPIFDNNCISCHYDGNSTGYTFTDYATISSNSSQSLGAMKNEGYQLMPEGGPALPDSLIKLVNCWILNGKPNN